MPGKENAETQSALRVRRAEDGELRKTAYTLRRNGKSAEVTEKKSPTGLPSRKRVQKGLKTKEFIEWGFLAE